MHQLEADSIRLSFDSRTILSDIYLGCRTGEVVGLLGRNGAGKSCLLQIVFGSMACEKSVRIDKQRYRTPFRHPELVRYLPQFNFIPGSFRLDKVFSDYLLDYSHFANFFPEFGGREKTKMGALSGGERRLVELYIIIWPETHFALLDEPFTHLNPLQIEKVKTLINEVKSRKGFVITDHMFLQMQDFCDRFLVLKDGRLHPAKSTEDIAALEYIRI